MNEFSLIAFDMDGTLTESATPIEPETITLLESLLRHKKIAIASGATLNQFEQQLLKHFSCDTSYFKNLYLLPTNGSALYEYDNGWRSLYCIDFTEDEAREIMNAFDQALVKSGYETPATTYGPIIEHRCSQVTFAGLGVHAPCEEKAKWDPDHTKRERIVKNLSELLPELSVTIGGTTSIDVTKKGINKAYGLRRLLKHLDHSKDQLLYIGDTLFPGGNDAPALTLGTKCVPVTTVSDTRALIRQILNEVPAERL